MADPRNDYAPAGNRGESETQMGTLSASSLSRTAHNGTADTLPMPIIGAAEVDEHLAGALVLLVRTSAGRHRRRVFLSVAAAQRAADRALQAGHAAEVVLCRLEPVGAVL